MLRYLFVFYFVFLLFLELAAEETSDDKTVMIAILARNKAHVLPQFLNCIEKLDYDKQLISLYINTNNNQDETEKVIREWVKKNEVKYQRVIFEKHEVEDAESTRPHEWTPGRFKILAAIRNKSLEQAKKYQTDYYFVVDCDNFITPCTLKELVRKDKPIIAPMLKSIPEIGDYYSNYFCAVSDIGYYQDHPDYVKILHRKQVGTFKVPLVHCTYLIKSEYLDRLNYADGGPQHEFVIFARSARENNVDQYICNERNFGVLLHFHSDLSAEEERNRIKDVEIENYLKEPSHGNIEQVFSHIYEKGIWGRNSKGEGFSGEGSSVENAAQYAKFLEDFITYNQIESVLDVGCGDWTFSQYIQWGKAHYTGIDVVKSVIDRNRVKFTSPTVTFLHCDEKFTDLPSADLVICKDVLQHLPTESILLFLNQIPKFKHCLITNDIDEWSTNKSIQAGDYRSIDLQKPPFNVKGVKILTFRSGYVTKQIFYVNNSN